MQVPSKIALITGAGTGIGKSVAKTLYQTGYSLVLTGRRIGKLKDAAAEIGSEAERTLLVPTDVSQPGAVQELFAVTKEKFGRLDLLFNNAGMNISANLLEEVPFEDWRKILDTNITGVFLCTQEAIKLMKSQNPMGGRIINNGSISAQVPRPNSAPYTATKHAVAGLTKATALDGRKYNIACGQIDIGNALTDMATAMAKGVAQADGSIAVEPTMDVQHVADAVLYMANLPLSANVLNMTVMASGMPFVGRG